jgi:hypothetical protein
MAIAAMMGVAVAPVRHLRRAPSVRRVVRAAALLRRASSARAEQMWELPNLR